MKSTKPYWNTLFLPTLILVFGSACTKTSNELDNGKARLENEIRGQVKFLEEPESLSSIRDKMKEYKIPALSLTVISQGKLAWTETYQNENFEQQINLDSTSIFQAASLSKPVTCLAALRMHAEGKIDLDKNIQEYLKEFVLPAGKQTSENPITFRNIFSHTSGISPGGYQGYDRAAVMPTDLDVLRGSAEVNTPPIEVVAAPNEMLAYSGGAYTLAELALQDIFNDDFSSIMKEWILEPAGMKNSEFTQPLPESEIHRVAKGYTQSGELIEGGWRNHPEQAAAGLWSTSADMAKFMIEIYKAYQGEPSIFSASDIKTILSHERDGHVYGFILNRSEENISLTHYGGNAGYRTGMTISLTSGNGLVYLINSDNGGALGNELFLSASQVYDWKYFKQTEVERKPVDSEILEGLSGKYRWNDQVDLSIAFEESKNQISLFFPNGDEYELVPIKGEELGFIHGNTGIQVSFARDGDKPSFMLYGQTAIKIINP
ncbi:serine hydrolase domain-containing protein [Algoriphagus algorifonticola]|uniref:serine hydrolase domain-containing protein n=1 Tax=Algoriphagus algorifonticola TaxID=2593007 RepID=UPI0011AAFA36|nr:serine hydrolase domain-containing protein [Algoriphagus algorifonticola]